jgi:uncharacterized protein (TIGR02145 family)
MKSIRFFFAAGVALALTYSCSDDSSDNPPSSGDGWKHPWNPNILYGEFTDKRDGQVYRAVVIGKQTWMAQNLNFETSMGSECYQYKDYNCEKYGRLYNGEVAMTVCPEGWRLPDIIEWEKLVSFVGQSSTYTNSATHLKAREGWEDIDPHYMAQQGLTDANSNGDDFYGFTALPGGRGSSGGGFSGIGYYSEWWTASEYSSKNAHYVEIYYMGHGVNIRGVTSELVSLYNVRCILDNIGGSL